jgi:ABC-type phosphate/phosphonate transport system substrate-binding protein
MASRRLPEDLVEQIRAVLLSLHEDPNVMDSLAEGLVKRFVPVSGSSYEDIRRMLNVCVAANFLAMK